MKSVILLFSLLAIGVCKPVTSNAQSRLQDSLALVDLYNSTDGPHWRNNTNWLSNLPIDQWADISINNDRVYQISLAYDGLTGTLPASLSNLTSLTYLLLQGNNLQGAVPALPNSGTMYIDVRYNFFTFQGMEAIAAAGGSFYYSRQGNIPITVSAGLLSADAGERSLTILTSGIATIHWY